MITPDKIGYFVAGLLIALIALAFTGRPWAALLAPFVLGFLKEAWDAAGHGTADFYDWLATSLGGVAVLVVLGLVV